MSILARNLAAAPELAWIRDVARRPDEIIARSHDGTPINGLRSDTRDRFFHSTYSPVKEAERLAGSVEHAGFVVALGLGMAHHIRILVSRARVLCVEPDAALARTALERTDLSDALDDGRLVLAVAETPSHLAGRLPSVYRPAIDGDLAVIELPGRTAVEPNIFAPYRDALRAASESIRSDVATQATFGLRWTRNAFLNLPHVRPRTLPNLSATDVAVVAAGPTMEDHLDAVASHAGPVLAVDTAVPILLAHGIAADLAFSIDCQIATYHHLLVAGHPGQAFLLDLSVSPSVTRALTEPVLALGDHPLHRLLADCGLDAPTIDVRGGNVAQTAVVFAARCGARSVRLYGADFSYPDGRTYPRGSYIHHAFESRADRLAPLEGEHLAFLLERSEPAAARTAPITRRNPLLDRYAGSMASCLAEIEIPVERIRGHAIELPRPTGLTGRRISADPATSRGTAGEGPGPDLQTVLTRVMTALQTVASEGVQRALANNGGHAALAAVALLPLMTELRAHGTPASRIETDALEITIGYVKHARSMID